MSLRHLVSVSERRVDRVSLYDALESEVDAIRKAGIFSTRRPSAPNDDLDSQETLTVFDAPTGNG
jgi:hypothetical protein